MPVRVLPHMAQYEPESVGTGSIHDAVPLELETRYLPTQGDPTRNLRVPLTSRVALGDVVLIHIFVPLL